MVRAAGFALMLLASASIALGSPVCCLLGNSCCGTKTTDQQAAPEQGCCSHCRKDRPEEPAPKPCDKKGCTCKHDVSTHVTAADHVPLVAVFEIAAVALPERATSGASGTSHRSLPHAPGRASHPLVL